MDWISPLIFGGDLERGTKSHRLLDKHRFEAFPRPLLDIDITAFLPFNINMYNGAAGGRTPLHRFISMSYQWP